MSRFEGMPEMETTGGTANYETGSFSYDPTLADDLVTHYLSSEDLRARDDFARYTLAEEYGPRLRIMDELDGTQVLEDIISACRERLPDMHMEDEEFLLQMLLNPVVNLLYQLDQNDFTLDLTTFPLLPTYIATYLTGNAKNPLRFSCLLGGATAGDGIHHTSEVGYEAEHLHLLLSRNAYAVGLDSKHCEFILEDLVLTMGWKAKGCTFLLPHVDSASVAERKRLITLTMVDTIGYTLTLEENDSRGFALVDKGFYARGNKVLIPSGPGEWQEVRP